MASTSPDIDRGLAFVVMLAVGLSFLLTIGVAHSTGVFYTTFLAEFEQSPTLTAWAVNLNTFCSYMFGELANVLMQRLSHRAVMVLGALISTAGLLACSFAPSLHWILVTFGLVTGIGYSLAVMPTYALIAVYFQRYRKLAFSVTSAGGAVGQFVHPPLFQWLSDAYHWRGAFLVMSGINLNLLVIAAVMMPPREAHEGVDREPDEMEILMVAEDGDGVAKERKSTWCAEILDRLLILTNPRFTAIFIGTFLSAVGISAFYTHVSNFGIVSGHGRMASAFLASVIGLGGIVARLGLGLLATHPVVHTPLLVTLFLTLAGVVSGLFGLMTSYTWLVIFCVALGFSAGVWGLLPEAVIVVTGFDRLAAGMSYVFISSAVGFLFGGPVAAWVYEADPSYVWSFVIVGFISTVGGLLLVPTCVVIRSGRLKLIEVEV